MACLERYNSSNPPPPQHTPAPTMSPRISFSNDFVESHNSNHVLSSSRSTPPASSDFEFSVSNHDMLSADELLFKGMLLPFKDKNNGGGNQRTLRDELLVDDDDIDFSLKPPKSASASASSKRWRGFLGLRKSHIGSKKPETSGSFDDAERFPFSLQDANPVRSPQEALSSEGPSSTEMEIGI